MSRKPKIQQSDEIRSKRSAGLKGQHRRPARIYSFQETDERLKDVFTNHGFSEYPDEKRHKLSYFCQLLLKEQQQQNITRLLSLSEVGLKHFIDCLIIPQVVQLPFPLLDVGTGAGFPGIPLKVEYPDQRIILAEGVSRRVQYLKNVRTQLALNHLDIIGRKIDKDFQYPVAGVITRAFADAHRTLSDVQGCLLPGARVFLMKGPQCDDEIRQAASLLKESFELEQSIGYTLPNSPHKRQLVVFKKK